MNETLSATILAVLITTLTGLLGWVIKQVLRVQDQLVSLRRQRIEIGQEQLPKVEKNAKFWDPAKWEFPVNHERSNDREALDEVTVKFKRAFYGPPRVYVALSKLDMGDAKANLHRVEVGAKDITAEGFDLYFRTWSQSLLFNATATWIAVSEEPLSWLGKDSK